MTAATHRLLLLFVVVLALFLHSQQDNQSALPPAAGTRRNPPSGAKFKEEDRPLQTTTAPCSVAEINRNTSLKELKHTTFLHVGKGGGGTINEVLVEQWHLRCTRCHPKPCPLKVAAAARDKEQATRAILVNVRDPIDRLVSTFYWILTIGCHPNKKSDTRIPIHTNVSERSDTHCVPPGEPPTKPFVPYYHQYEQDVNLFAAALCSTDPTVKEKAMKHWDWNGHGRLGLVDWFSFLLGDDNTAYNADTIYPIVMEKSVADIATQTHRAVEWMHNYTHFEDVAAFQQRRQVALLDPACRQKKAAPTTGKRHASTVRKVPLSLASEQCLAGHLRQDYALLPLIQTHLCKSQDCRQGIQSMLERRRHLFT